MLRSETMSCTRRSNLREVMRKRTHVGLHPELGKTSVRAGNEGLKGNEPGRDDDAGLR